MKISIEFGCLCPPLAEQLDTQGVVYDDSIIAGFHTDADVLERVKLRHLMPLGQINIAYDKLSKRIFEHLRNPYEE